MIKEHENKDYSEKGFKINRFGAFHFVIFGLQNLYDAISAEMYKRVIGASYFSVSFLHLIDCSEDYNKFVSKLLKDFECIIVEHGSVKEFMDFAAKRKEDEIYVVDAWPSRIHIARRLKQINKNVAVIDDYPISFERFNSDNVIDRILVSPLVYKFRFHTQLKTLKMVNCVVSNSEVTSDFLKRKCNFASNFISYPPIHSHIFRRDPATKRDSIVIHSPVNLDGNDESNIILALKSISFKNIWLLNPSKVPQELLKTFRDSIIVKRRYLFDEIRDIYSHCYLSIIPESLGTFEGVPIESIASGVPILGSPVSSINIINELLLKSGVEEEPFFSLQNFNPLDFKKWVFSIQNSMAKISDIVNFQFSPKSIMKEFIENLNSAIS